MNHRFRIIAAVALALFVVCSLGANARDIKEVIVPQKAHPVSIMICLGLLDYPDYFDYAGKDIVWYPERKDDKKQRTITNPIPSEISMIKVPKQGDSIIVEGNRRAINEFKQLMVQLDVPQKTIQIKAELYKLDKEMLSQFGSENIDRTALLTDSKAAQSLLDEIRKTKEPINSPIISTLNCMPATIELRSDRLVNKLGVMTRINVDGTITIFIQYSIERWSEESKEKPVSFQTIRTNRRIKDGDVIMVGGLVDDEGEELELFLTTKVIKE